MKAGTFGPQMEYIPSVEELKKLCKMPSTPPEDQPRNDDGSSVPEDEKD